MPIRLASEDLSRLSEVFQGALELRSPPKIRSELILVATFGLALPPIVSGNRIGRADTLPEAFRRERERRLYARAAWFTDLAALAPRTPGYESVGLQLAEAIAHAVVLEVRRRYTLPQEGSRGVGRPATRALQHFVVHEVEPLGLPLPPAVRSPRVFVGKALAALSRFSPEGGLLFYHHRVDPFVQIFTLVYRMEGVPEATSAERLASLWEEIDEAEIAWRLSL